MIAALLTSALLLCEEPKPIPMQASAYCDYGTTADGSTTIEHLTCAGKREWFGRTIALYRRNKDDSIGEFIGYYEMRDTGYGYSTGEGTSEVRSDKKYAGNAFFLPRQKTATYYPNAR